MMTVRTVFCFAAALCCTFAQTSSPQRLFEDAVKAQQHGDYGRAADLYRQVVKISPEVPAGWINLGIVLVQLGNVEEGVQCYEKALALEPKNAPVQLDLALAWYKRGDFVRASKPLQELARALPKDLRIALLLGDCYLHLGDTGPVLPLLAPFEKAAAGNTDYAWVYGSALIANGRLKEGAELVENAAKATSAPDAYLLAGDALLRLNLSERALDDLKKAVELNPDLPGLYFLLGSAYEKNADYKSAAEAFRKAIERNPSDFNARLRFAGVLYFERDIPAAKAALQEALKLDPASVDARYTMALIEKSEGLLDEAVADLEAVTGARPNFMPAHADLAALYFRLHRSKEAERERQIVDRLAAEERKAGPSSAPQ
ncbi:MAG TPA: tetratricopeptide repeat protein [Bryobacteraceae bacterium]|nr:tetratricopeptide repeat protein [Bryobacteraceae bacterium]